MCCPPHFALEHHRSQREDEMIVKKTGAKHSRFSANGLRFSTKQKTGPSMESTPQRSTVPRALGKSP
jgi:hypothetical protein